MPSKSHFIILYNSTFKPHALIVNLCLHFFLFQEKTGQSNRFGWRTSWLTLDLPGGRLFLLSEFLRNWTFVTIINKEELRTCHRLNCTTCKLAKVPFVCVFFFSGGEVGGGGGGLFHEHWQFTGQQGKGEAISLTPRDYCRELTSAHSLQPDSNREPLVSECKSLSTRLRALSFEKSSTENFFFKVLENFPRKWP